MNISTMTFGKVLIVIDSADNRYVTIDGKTKRFGLYAMAEVDKEFSAHNSVEQAYTTVFNKLPEES